MKKLMPIVAAAMLTTPAMAATATWRDRDGVIHTEEGNASDYPGADVAGRVPAPAPQAAVAASLGAGDLPKMHETYTVNEAKFAATYPGKAFAANLPFHMASTHWWTSDISVWLGNGGFGGDIALEHFHDRWNRLGFQSRLVCDSLCR